MKSLWFVLLGSTNGLLLALYLAHAVAVSHPGWALAGLFSDPRMALDMDRGYAEVFGYVQEFWVVLAALGLAWLRRAPAYLAWALLFAYLLLDDFYGLHEALAPLVAARAGLGPLGGLEPAEAAELLVLLGVGLALAGAVALAYGLARPETRAQFRQVVPLVLLLPVFGVVVDAVHEKFVEGRFNLWLELLEDGGEMAAISLVCWKFLELLAWALEAGRIAPSETGLPH
ncbi:hypothetical protein Mterra_03414 [Calidithermus terrae]|uniref:Uncharacterized protein n=1 Tax=Calidithermus terrae TaxID=1408545 RepID=A0A399EAH2_9DEIN|nr:hypothetical protein [Calidithermus terrae]RIH80958.1 hypothetical protein Mterra_03414 [Calidithermus terrae]